MLRKLFISGIPSLVATQPFGSAQVGCLLSWKNGVYSEPFARSLFSPCPMLLYPSVT